MKIRRLFCSHRLIGEVGRIYNYDQEGNITHIYTLERCTLCGKHFKKELPDTFQRGRPLYRVISDYFCYELEHDRKCIELNDSIFGEVVVNCNSTAIGIVTIEQDTSCQARPKIEVLHGNPKENEKWYSTGVKSTVEELQKEIEKFDEYLNPLSRISIPDLGV